MLVATKRAFTGKASLPARKQAAVPALMSDIMAIGSVGGEWTEQGDAEGQRKGEYAASAGRQGRPQSG